MKSFTVKFTIKDSDYSKLQQRFKDFQINDLILDTIDKDYLSKFDIKMSKYSVKLKSIKS